MLKIKKIPCITVLCKNKEEKETRKKKTKIMSYPKVAVQVCDKHRSPWA